MTKNLLTKDGLKKLQDELQFLSTIERNRALTDLTDARERGNIEENSEYLSAKEEYEKIQDKISKLQFLISNSQIITSSDVATDKVTLLSKVDILNIGTKKKMTFTIVPENEIDIKNGKISSNSPIGAGLLGKKVDEICTIKTPAAILEFKIIKISL